MAAATAASLALAGLTVDVASNPPALAGMSALAALGGYYRYVRPDPRLAAVVIAALQVLLVLMLGILLTYAASATPVPYRDGALYALDRALGLDRQAYLAFFGRLPWLAEAIGLAYQTLLPQFALVPLALLLAGQEDRVRALIVATGLALMATSAIAVFIPAVDAFVYVDLAPRLRAGLGDLTQTQVPTLEALRAGALHAIRLDRLEGLITFPSFHTAGGLLFAWALWSVARLRWAGLLLNAALIAATPLVGAHYFVDLAGGAAVAAVSIVAACRLSGVPVLASAVPATTAVAAAP